MSDVEEDYGWGDEWHNVEYERLSKRRYKRMELTVDAVAKHGNGIKATDGQWYNMEKGSKQNFTEVKPGFVLSIQKGEKDIKSFTVVSDKAKVKSFGGGSSSGGSNPAASRGAAVKAAGSLLGELVKDMDLAEAFKTVQPLIKELAAYIDSGKFSNEG